MIVYKKYCRYCGKPYSYQLSGNGCSRDLNNEQFCPDCMEIMLNALKQSGIEKYRFHRKLRKYTPLDIELEAFKKLDEEYQEEEKKIKDNSTMLLPSAISMMPIYDCKHIIGYNYNHRKFYKCWNNEDESDLKWLTYYLFDSSKNEYTDEVYSFEDVNSNYRFNCQGLKSFKSEDIKSAKLSPPSSTIFFSDITTDGTVYKSYIEDPRKKRQWYDTLSKEDYAKIDWMKDFMTEEQKLRAEDKKDE